MIKSMENFLGCKVTNFIMKEVSTLVIDGISVNTGNNKGVWKIFQDYRLEKFSEPVAPPTYNMVLCTKVKYGMEGSK